MTAYVSISFNQRKNLQEEVDAITRTLVGLGIAPFVFVDKYRFDLSDEKEMMLQAMKDIENADLLIACATCKAIGVGLEAGYASAKGKPVVYLRAKDAEHSTTLSGISDFHVIYKDMADLRDHLSNVLRNLVA